MKVPITSKSKIKNPMDNTNNIYSFEGEFNQDMFHDDAPQSEYLKFQKLNLEKILSIFEEKNLHFEYIWMGTFNNDSGNKANNFIIKSNINEDGMQIFWYKYATANPGSGQNWIYTVKDDAYQKIQLSKWLDNGYLE